MFGGDPRSTESGNRGVCVCEREREGKGVCETGMAGTQSLGRHKALRDLAPLEDTTWVWKA